MHTLFAPEAHRSVDPLASQMKVHLALITLTKIHLAKPRAIAAVLANVIATEGEDALVGLVLPRLCTERSMRAEAERIQTALQEPSEAADLALLKSRAIFGGLEAIADPIAEIDRIARLAQQAAAERAAAAALREREGKSHLAGLIGRTKRDRRRLGATSLS
jgi:hypothetical protein